MISVAWECRWSVAPAAVLPALAIEIGAGVVHWNRRIDPAGAARDAKVAEPAGELGIVCRVHRGSFLFAPETTLNANGTPPRVFRAFWKRCSALPEPDAPLPVPSRITPFAGVPPASDPVPSEPSWAGSLAETWTPGGTAALDRLTAFLDNDVLAYRDRRDRVDLDGTSRLSPRPRFGEIPPRTVWRAPSPIRRRPRESTPSRVNWSGVSSPTSRSTTIPGSSIVRSIRASNVSRGSTIPPPSTPGSGDAPGTPWSTRACAGCGARDGCTTGPGWSPPRSRSRTSSSPGARERRGSPTRSSARSGVERPQPATGRRPRRGCRAVLPNPQSGDSARRIRPRRRVYWKISKILGRTIRPVRRSASDADH